MACRVVSVDVGMAEGEGVRVGGRAVRVGSDWVGAARERSGKMRDFTIHRDGKWIISLDKSRKVRKITSIDHPKGW